MKLLISVIIGLCIVIINYGWIPFVLNFFYQAFMQHGGVWQPFWINFTGYLGTVVIAVLVASVCGALLLGKK